MQANLYAQDANGVWTPVRVSETGGLVGGSSGGSGLPAGQSSALAPWSYAAASGGITDTADVTLIAAPGAGMSNYLTSIQVMNSSATATEVVVKSSSTVLWRARIGASMTAPVSINFLRPLIGANNTALTVACITNATVTYVNAQGYTDASIAVLNAERTAANEIFDQAGAQVFDQAGNPVYAQAA